MKLNWFAPVPPTPSSIAFDTAAVLPALAKHADITLWVHEPHWLPELQEHARVIHYNPAKVPWAEINRADATVFHFGNHTEVHAPIWMVNRQHPGIVVLHDICVQNFFGGLVERGFLSTSEYGEMMQFYHPKRGGWIAGAWVRGAAHSGDFREECPLTGAALENATGVIVHTEDACALLRAATNIPVSYVPLFVLPEPSTSDRDRDESAVYRIIMFGFLTANRRLKSVLKVLARLPQKHRFQLEVYGMLEEQDSIRRMIDLAGLTNSVRLHGFVADRDLAAALEHSDLAINLRDPTMGEASSSQLRIWQHGLPSLVTDTGWYRTLPRDTVAFVRRYAELEDIEMHLTNFLRDPALYRRLGENGRRHVDEHHTISNYVRSLMVAIEVTVRDKHCFGVRRTSYRAGRAVQPWYASDAVELVTRNVAQEIDALFNDAKAAPRRIADVASPTPG